MVTVGVKVRRGDTLSSIAQEVLGAARHYPIIYRQNKELIDAAYAEYLKVSKVARRINEAVFRWPRIERAEDCVFPGMELTISVPERSRDTTPRLLDANSLLQELEGYPASSPVHYHELREIIERCAVGVRIQTIGGGSGVGLAMPQAPKPRS